MKKTTMEDILSAKKLIDGRKNEHFYSETFKSEIEIEDISGDKIAELINAQDETAPIRGDCEIIYASCPIFRSRELQEAFEVKDPIDVIEKAFGGNIFEIDKLAKHIMKRYGFYGNDIEKIKKQ